MRGWLSKSFLLALALFGVSELAVRIFFAHNMSGRFVYGYHPTAGFVDHADGRTELVRAGGRRFRPQTFIRERPPDVVRIVVVGDSVPRGSSFEDAYVARLAALLRERGLRAEAINLAVAGYGARRNHIVLAQALKYQPSLILRHLNDSNEYEDEREWRRSQEFQSWHPRNWLMKSLILRRLYEAKTEKIFWEWLPEAVRVQRGVNDADAELAAGMNEDTRTGWTRQVRDFAAQDLALARKANVPLLFITQARRLASTAGTEVLDDSGLDALAQELMGNGAFVSMKRTFSALDLKRNFADSSHLTPQGHAVLARAIAEVWLRLSDELVPSGELFR